jgi:hypothetical protein
MITGLIAGSMFLLLSHIKQADLNWTRFIIPQNMTKLLIMAVFATFLSNFRRDPQSSIIVVMSTAMVCSVPLLFLGWFNPVRMMLLNRGNHEI